MAKRKTKRVVRKARPVRARRSTKSKVKRTITTTKTDKIVRTLGSLHELSTRQAEVYAAGAIKAADRARKSADSGSCQVAVIQLVSAALQTGAADAAGGARTRSHNDLRSAELAVRKHCTK